MSSGGQKNSISCILPQYSLPLIHSSVLSDTLEITCAIQLSLCCETEAVIIFGFKQVFCEYNEENKTCSRNVIDNDTIVYSTTITKDAESKFYPEEYIFCNSMGSYLSIRIIWATDSDSNATEPTESQPSTSEIGLELTVTGMEESETSKMEIDVNASSAEERVSRTILPLLNIA
uniref:Uncharacterized protein n=1 Tax=Schistocephalus solidus TaxID=70667 RepID=A0A0X3P0P9_SCHSO